MDRRYRSFLLKHELGFLVQVPNMLGSDSSLRSSCRGHRKVTGK